MISIATEDKIRKGLGLLFLLSMPLFTIVIKDDTLKLMVLIPLLVVMSLLLVRKFIRDRKGGKPLNRYYIAFGFMLVSLALFLFGLYSV